MLTLLRSKVTGAPLEESDWAEFRGYQLGMEVAEMITASPLVCPDRILLWAARNRRLVVAEAAFQAIMRKVFVGETSWIEVFGKSSSKAYRSAYERLAIDQALHCARTIQLCLVPSEGSPFCSALRGLHARRPCGR